MGGIAEEDNEDSPAVSESDAFLGSPRRQGVFTMDSRLSRFADDSGYEDNQQLNQNQTQSETKPSSPPPSPSPKWASSQSSLVAQLIKLTVAECQSYLKIQQKLQKRKKTLQGAKDWKTAQKRGPIFRSIRLLRFIFIIFESFPESNNLRRQSSDLKTIFKTQLQKTLSWHILQQLLFRSASLNKTSIRIHVEILI